MFDKITKLFEKIGKDHVFTQAAALSYTTALALAPMVLLLVTLASFLRFDLQEQFLIEMKNLMGEEASVVFKSIIESAKNRPDLTVTAGWIAAFVLAFSASVVFIQLQNSLNIIFGAKEVENTSQGHFEIVKDFIMRRLLSIGILLTLIFISIVSLGISAMMAYFMTTYDFLGMRIFANVINLVVYGFLFALLYQWMPDQSMKRRQSLIAGFFTAIMFTAGKSLIGTYIGQTAVGSAYGAAGSLIVLLVWIYYSALIFFLGAELASFFLASGANEKRV